MAAGQTGHDSDISKAGRNVHADLIEGAGQPPIELYSLAPAWLFRNIERRKNAGGGAPADNWLSQNLWSILLNNLASYNRYKVTEQGI
jgi:hypothetical protein